MTLQQHLKGNCFNFNFQFFDSFCISCIQFYIGALRPKHLADSSRFFQKCFERKMRLLPKFQMFRQFDQHLEYFRICLIFIWEQPWETPKISRKLSKNNLEYVPDVLQTICRQGFVRFVSSAQYRIEYNQLPNEVKSHSRLDVENGNFKLNRIKLVNAFVCVLRIPLAHLNVLYQTHTIL